MSQLPAVLTDRCAIFGLDIHGNDHHEYQGRVVHLLGHAALPFRSMMEGLWAVERMIDGVGYIQKAVKPRTWQGAPIARKVGNRSVATTISNQYVEGWNMQTEQEALLPMKQTSASFVVKIQYRQNATWQGTLEWLDGHRTQHFRSTMEMLKLIEEVVEATDIPGDDFVTDPLHQS